MIVDLDTVLFEQACNRACDFGRARAIFRIAELCGDDMRQSAQRSTPML
jgi:hypothetical protein